MFILLGNPINLLFVLFVEPFKTGSCCQIEQDSESSVGTPTTDGAPETTYSCVASDNCNYEVHVIGNYESSNGVHDVFVHGVYVGREAGDTDVVLTVTGESPRPLILVMTSYEPVRWRLSVTSGVTIDRVILVSFERGRGEGALLGLSLQSGYYISTVSSTPSNGILETEILMEPDNHYGYGSDSGGGRTAELLLYLQQRFGPVSSFSGSYRADRWEINIHRTAGICCIYHSLPNITICQLMPHYVIKIFSSFTCSFINEFQSPPDCSKNSALRSCPVPAAPGNGAVEVTGVQPIVASYTCHEGTILVGSEIRTCQEDGSWSGEEPSCRIGMMHYHLYKYYLL